MYNIVIFDTHSHLHSNFFKKNSEEIAKKMEEKNIWTISVGVSQKDSEQAVKFVKNKKNFYCTIGIHPTEKEVFNEHIFQTLLNKNRNKIVGIGECGLDYYWPNKDLRAEKINNNDFNNELMRQKKLFIKQIEFASKNNLPLMLHIRPYKNQDAYNDALTILKQYPQLKANFHFFTENANLAHQIQQNKNYTISIPGVCTFADIDNTLSILNLKQTMIETDSPFATPKPFRGKINTPLYVEKIAEKIAEIKKINIKNIKKITIQNTLNFWNINQKD